MKVFEIKVTQSLSGHYNGTVEIEAESKEEALFILKNMGNSDIDDMANWTHGDEYDGDITTIKIDEDSITELL